VPLDHQATGTALRYRYACAPPAVPTARNLNTAISCAIAQFERREKVNKYYSSEFTLFFKGDTPIFPYKSMGYRGAYSKFMSKQQVI